MLDGNLGMVYLTIINVLKISNHMNNEASVAGSLEVGGEEAEHGGGGGGGGGPHLIAADVPAHHPAVLHVAVLPVHALRPVAHHPAQCTCT